MIESRAILPVAGLLALVALAAPPKTQPVPVPREVTVASPLLRVGDLAPGNRLAAKLAATVLAPSPQPGSPLRLSRGQLQAQLRRLGVNPARFVIPSQVEIVRQAQAIPFAAVIAAVSSYLRRPVAPSELLYSAPATTAAAPAVVVVRERVDAAHGRLELLCRDRNDPQLLPFAVSLALSPAALSRRAAAARARELAWARAVVKPRPRAVPMPTPILVQPGHTANLLINTPGFALVTQVMPLEPGRLGQHIRVTSLATHAVLPAVVSGKNQLRAAASINLTYAGLH